MLKKRIQALFNPERYHGWGKTKNYFEGWYYKVLTADEKYAFAFIPGIAMDNEGNRQAFIQILDGKKLSAEYIKFSYKEFASESSTYRTEISDNIFEIDEIRLNLETAQGELQFKKSIPWPPAYRHSPPRRPA